MFLCAFPWWNTCKRSNKHILNTKNSLVLLLIIFDTVICMHWQFPLETFLINIMYIAYKTFFGVTVVFLWFAHQGFKFTEIHRNKKVKENSDQNNVLYTVLKTYALFKRWYLYVFQYSLQVYYVADVLPHLINILTCTVLEEYMLQWGGFEKYNLHQMKFNFLCPRAYQKLLKADL